MVKCRPYVQNRLKGDISADGKLTTTWGELKTLHE